jgi:hypothetical protein
MNWKEIKVAEDATHFLYGGNKIGNKNFIEVLKYHAPGIAPVKDESGAYHLNSKGIDLYPERYTRTFGYYDNRAAVVSEKGWFHIDEKGKRIYPENFAWTGNFQEDVCTVRDAENNYFHIYLDGNRIYEENYLYAGDFKDGLACVKQQNGNFKHMNKNGNFINDKEFSDLGVYHKNYATAKDEKGWFHIDKKGIPLYEEKYLITEPFYNGFALVTNFNNEKCIIDENGNIILEIKYS